jgi:hypothetical protein
MDNIKLVAMKNIFLYCESDFAAITILKIMRYLIEIVFGNEAKYHET